MTKQHPHPAPWHITVPSDNTIRDRLAIAKALPDILLVHVNRPDPQKLVQKSELWAIIGRHGHSTDPAIRDILSKLAQRQYPQLLSPLLSFSPLISDSFPVAFLSNPITPRYVLHIRCCETLTVRGTLLITFSKLTYANVKNGL